MSAVFTVSGVTRRFESAARTTLALDDIDLEVQDGEFLVLLGPSGCGKSTLLELLAGLQCPDAGRVAFGGETVEAPRPDVGVVFQDAALYPWRTVLRNVALPLEIAGVPRREREGRARRQLERVGLGDFVESYPGELSGGMRQRAGIARALTQEPDVLLMDEPFGALDHLTRVQLQEDLLELWSEQRRTVVFVTHDVGEAVYLADRIVVLSARPGRIRAELPVRAARPRLHGDPELIALESEVYRILREFEDPLDDPEYFL
ncbi:ABC transporter ATP-binding protein [Microbacterium sp. KR10-403]|uniref:ABC transporter ATP-binding protein n=1 Tax=Microbacterium sp. KR10-403 TaxID=3158581 RepID=UPI0032E3D483